MKTINIDRRAGRLDVAAARYQRVASQPSMKSAYLVACARKWLLDEALERTFRVQENR